jgi:hypothetical protein
MTTVIQSFIVYAPVEIEGEGKERGRKKKNIFQLFVQGTLTEGEGSVQLTSLLR